MVILNGGIQVAPGPGTLRQELDRGEVNLPVLIIQGLGTNRLAGTLDPLVMVLRLLGVSGSLVRLGDLLENGGSQPRQAARRHPQVLRAALPAPGVVDESQAELV